ncbi:MAG: galactokinase [Bacteroidetes bacterium]|nr:galactokinase [Bacteroidota bacterium]
MSINENTFLNPSPSERGRGEVYFAPGRINLIGEHLDYNGGLVLPAALTIGVKATLTKRTDDKIKLSSATHPFSIELNTSDEIVYDVANDWTNYPLGVIKYLRQEGYEIPACDVVYESNMPEGSGLSSSAAVEVLTAFALIDQAVPAPSGRVREGSLVWLANLCKQVENEFIGVNCGIMDQYSVALGKRDNAILIDCAELRHQYIPIDLEDYKLMVMNTNKPRKLVNSKYNERRAECEEALKKIQAWKPEVKHLCECSISDVYSLTDEVLQRRAKHVISENLRVKESVKMLRFNDLSTFGRLMNASHNSLRDDYEVTGLELDTLAETAQEVKGCLGARMTGGGFSGCAIALVHSSAIPQFIDTVSARYLNVTGIACDIYESEIGDGVAKMTN